MRVLHISTPSGWRGGEQQVAYLAMALAELGIDQVVLCPEDSVLSRRLATTGVSIAGFHGGMTKKVSLLHALRKICLSQAFDIIHCHDSHAHSAVITAGTFLFNPPPAVVSRRVDFPVSDHYFSRKKYNHPLVRKILCVSETIRQITLPAILDPSRLMVIHSGIDLSKYAQKADRLKLRNELGLAPGTPLVGNLSALADHKDYPTFIRTAQNVIARHPSVHFIIAGQGPEEKTISKMITDLGLGSHIHMLGFRDDVRDVMQSLDVFLITSVTEGLGTIVLEAFAAGVPVVATRAGGIPEMVEDYVTGLLGPVGDAASLAEAVLKVLSTPALSHMLSDQATRRVADFTYQDTALKTKAVYEDLISSKVV